MKTLRIIIIKPSKYLKNGYVERFWRGFMPNSTLFHLRSMIPEQVNGYQIESYVIDEHVQSDLKYLNLLRAGNASKTLVAIVGVQSHQFHRALDLAAFSVSQGCMAIIGGPHVMTCDTSMFHAKGVSFAMAEAEMIWPTIINDATSGELASLYGNEQRWQMDLDSFVIKPPSHQEREKYLLSMLGLYPARGCPFICNFCSVIKIAGRQVRSQSIESIIESMRLAKKAGIKWIMFTSDNFNKYKDAETLLEIMIEEKFEFRLMVQCDTQVSHQDRLVELLGTAGCGQIFVGAESFDKATLKAAGKKQNRPEKYEKIIDLCRRNKVKAHFSNIIGFPDDNEATVHNHLKVLKELNPELASFYILTPIPGTEQYAEFKADGLITETNLDRFDTSYLVWDHPNFDNEQLQTLLFNCYKSFYTHTRMVKNLFYKAQYHRLKSAIGSAGIAFFNHYSAVLKSHPMSGGIIRTNKDSVKDYIGLRKKYFDIELAPLPDNIELPEKAMVNQSVKTNTRQSQEKSIQQRNVAGQLS